jgi:hypothetical protein
MKHCDGPSNLFYDMTVMILKAFKALFYKKSSHCPRKLTLQFITLDICSRVALEKSSTICQY